MAVDGEITIGTKLDTDKFDRQITDLEKKIKKEEENANIKLSVKNEQEKELEKEMERTDKLAQQYEKLLYYKKQYQKAENTLLSPTASPEEWTKAQEKIFELGSLIGDSKGEFSKITAMENQLDKASAKEEQLRAKISKTEDAYQGILNKVTEYKQKIENVDLQRQVSDTEKIKSNFGKFGSSIQKSIKDVARLALAVFGVRSAYLALRRASSDLASYDQQYATNLEYIRYALTQAIAPVLQWIVRLAATLLGYINAIMQGWFGINLFARGSAENFNKMKAGASGASKAVKEIKKQLAGFDEINMLTDQSDTGTSGGAGGVGMPNFDLSAMQGEVPEWLQWIIDHRDEILSTIAGITVGLLAWKLGLGGIKALGIGILIKGILDTIISLKKFIENPSWENFGKVLKGIGEILLGLGIIIGNIPLIVAGAIAIIVGLVIQNWDKIKEILGKVGQWINDKIIKPVTTIFTSLWQKIKEGAENAWNRITEIFSNIGNWFGNVINTIIDKFKQMGQKAGDVMAGAFKTVVNGILRAIENILNTPIRAINTLINTINAIPRNKHWKT